MGPGSLRRPFQDGSPGEHPDTLRQCLRRRGPSCYRSARLGGRCEHRRCRGCGNSPARGGGITFLSHGEIAKFGRPAPRPGPGGVSVCLEAHEGGGLQPLGDSRRWEGERRGGSSPGPKRGGRLAEETQGWSPLPLGPPLPFRPLLQLQ